MSNLFKGPTISPAAAPDPEEAAKKARERAAKVAKSTEGFVQRNRGLGPILLQAPTLSTGSRR
jgi:hypothetical protein